MITAITAKNQTEYQKLFAEASALLVANGQLDPAYGEISITPDEYAPGYYYILNGEHYELCNDAEFSAEKTYFIQISAITTLEEYFCHLGDLYETEGTKSKFILLPLDEDAFEIDANARTITVPASFRKAGVGVQGDCAAETLLFKINRFFDAVDLADTRIFVQWERADGTQYVSEISLKDTETYIDESKFIFGWPVSENLTKTAGTIKFAVRFIKQDMEGKIVYSFSTLTAQATINPGLDFDLDEVNVDDGASDLFAEVIENSTDSTGPQPDEPEFLNVVVNPLAMTNDGAGNYTAKVKYQVAVDDMGQTYFKQYFRKDENTKRVNLASNANSNQKIETVYEKTTDSVRNAKKNYFVQKEAGYVRDDGSAAMSELYEQFAVLTLSGTTAEIVAANESPVTGTYFAEAVNRLGRKEASKKSEFVEVPAPTKPVVATDLPAALTKGESGASLASTFTTDAQAEVSYKWKKSLDLSSWTEVDASTGPSLTTNEVGYYKVEATAVMNLGKISAETSVCKVVDLPVAPVWAIGYEPTEEIAVDIPAKKLTAVLATNPADNGPLYSDRVYFKWVSGETGAVYAETSVPELEITSETLGGGNTLRCVAVNELNGKKAEAKGALFVTY